MTLGVSPKLPESHSIPIDKFVFTAQDKASRSGHRTYSDGPPAGVNGIWRVDPHQNKIHRRYRTIRSSNSGKARRDKCLRALQRKSPLCRTEQDIDS